MLPVNSSPSPICIPFVSFDFSCAMLKTNGQSKHHCFVPDVKGTLFSLHHQV